VPRAASKGAAAEKAVPFSGPPFDGKQLEGRSEANDACQRASAFFETQFGPDECIQFPSAIGADHSALC